MTPAAAGEADAVDPAAAGIRELLAEAPRWGYVEALTRLEAADPEAPRIGHLGPAARERVRLRAALAPVFASSDIAEIREVPGAERPQWQVTATFLGLYGPASPLPSYVTENLLVEEAAPVRAFLDILNHRLLALCYRAATKYRPPLADWRRQLLALLGRSMDDGIDGLPGSALIACGGLLALQPRSPSALASVLSLWFDGIPAQVESCHPVWTELPTENLVRLGQRNATLGGDCTIGDRIRNRTTAFLVRLGPLPGDRLIDFLPHGREHAMLRALVDDVAEGRFDAVVELLAAPEAMPVARLGDGAAALGWSARLAGDHPVPYCIRITLRA